MNLTHSMNLKMQLQLNGKKRSKRLEQTLEGLGAGARHQNLVRKVINSDTIQK
jgi:hypothetical protein